jgi:hypothetical protein
VGIVCTASNSREHSKCVWKCACTRRWIPALRLFCSCACSKGFSRPGSSSSSGGAAIREPGASGTGIGNSEVSLKEEDRKWRLEPAEVAEWEVSSWGVVGGAH